MATKSNKSNNPNSGDQTAEEAKRKNTKSTGREAVKSLLKPITAKTAAKPAAKAKEEPKAEPPRPVAPKPEVVSLIDDKPKKVNRTKGASSTALPPISAILPAIGNFRPQKPKAEPEPEPEPTPAPVTSTAIEAEPSDEKVLHIKAPIVVRDLATALNLKPFVVIGDLMAMNIFVNLTQSVDLTVATEVCKKHGFTIEKEKREKGAGVHKPVEKIEEPKAPEPPKANELELRSPIVTFMGHVDHGKTTLMDAIRKARVAQGEAGGITQHIGAYSVNCKGQRITFLDTPGHAAFTAMRARGANVTDIVVLIVAADDGIMPQTIEALNHAKAAKVHIMVAITKMDVPGANLDRVKGQLQEKGLSPEDWGGETIVTPVSAIKGQGVDQLLENILLVAEIAELKGSPRGECRATVIEAQMEQGRGATATVIVRTGTLKTGDPFICGDYDGKVKALIDDTGKPIKTAPPATPCRIVGFAGMPGAGDELVVMKSEKEAKALSFERLEAKRLNKLATPERATLESLFARTGGEKPVLKIVLKTDVQGSLEAIVGSLNKIQSKKVDIEFIHTAVGPISESDVVLAAASNAIIIGFSVKTENVAAATAKRENIQIKLYSIIYELIDQVKEAMAGLLAPESRETSLGHAEIRKKFELTKGTVAGCYVTDGRILRVARARIMRDRTPIYDGPLTTLRRFQEDVKEVRSGYECGIKLGDFDEYTEGDIIECYQLEKVAQKL